MRRLYIITTFVYSLIVFVESTKQVSGYGVGVPTELLHVAVYFVLAYLVLKSLRGFKIPVPVSVAALLLTGGYGALIEVYQFFLPYRVFSFFDIACNFAGAFFLVAGIRASGYLSKYVPFRINAPRWFYEEEE